MSLKNDVLYEVRKKLMEDETPSMDIPAGIPADGKELPMAYSAFMTHSLGIPRSSMPQINSNNALANSIMTLTKKYGLKREKVKLGDLKPTQSELYNDKIKEKAKDKIELDDINFIVSQDGHLADSHHLWAAALEQYGTEAEVNVYRVPLETGKMLGVLNSLDTTTQSK